MGQEEEGGRTQAAVRAGGHLPCAEEAAPEVCSRGAYELICVEGDRVEGEARASGHVGGR